MLVTHTWVFWHHRALVLWRVGTEVNAVLFGRLPNSATDALVSSEQAVAQFHWRRVDFPSWPYSLGWVDWGRACLSVNGLTHAQVVCECQGVGMYVVPSVSCLASGALHGVESIKKYHDLEKQVEWEERQLRLNGTSQDTLAKACSDNGLGSVSHGNQVDDMAAMNLCFLQT